jgi:hypothetical protein
MQFDRLHQAKNAKPMNTVEPHWIYWLASQTAALDTYHPVDCHVVSIVMFARSMHGQHCDVRHPNIQN